MTSTRPYLIRAFYDWIVDNNCTPHIVVNAELPNVEVPKEYIEGGQIVLNIAMPAVQTLELGDESIEFQARFGGRSHYVFVPTNAVMAIYARENGRGMVFADDEPDPNDPQDEKDKSDKEEKDKDKGKGGKSGKNGRPHLTVIK